MNVERSTTRQPGSPGDAETGDSWHFGWLDDPHEAFARITGRLNWRGFEVEFALDSLAGIDGRLSGPSLETLPTALQQLVLSHCAEACLDTFASGPLAGMALMGIDWHDTPVPVQSDFAFSVRRPGVRGASLGWLTVRREAARRKLMAAVVSQDWPLPGSLVLVEAALRMGSVTLTNEELQGLEVGDVVWVDDAELAPAGLRVHVQSQGDDVERPAWIKRSEMRLDPAPQGYSRHPSAPLVGSPASGGEDITLTVMSPLLVLPRNWLLGGAPVQRLDRPAQAIPWLIVRDGNTLAQGALVVVGRRVGLRITHRAPRPATTEQKTG